jgi:hypothetical protein
MYFVNMDGKQGEQEVIFLLLDIPPPPPLKLFSLY